MRKDFLFLVSMFLAVFSFSQQSPVHFEALARKTGNNTYAIELKAKISEGWYVYAENKTSSVLEPLTVKCENELIQMVQPIIHTPVNITKDKIFNSELNVYTGYLSLLQNIHVNGEVPAELPIRITGFVARGEEFYPIEETCTITLEGGSNKADGAIWLSSDDLARPLANWGGENTSGKGMLAIFLLGFVGGLIALPTGWCLI